MESLDTPTLLLVNIVFNVIAIGGWALVAGVFRMAPRASWLMVGAHLCRVLQLTIDEFTARWSEWALGALDQGWALASITLLALALRRMLRLDTGRRDIALIAGLGALGLVVMLVLRQGPGMVVVASLALALLALGAARDVISGAGPGLANWATGLLALPHLVLAGLCLARLALLSSGAEKAMPGLLQHGRQISPLLNGLWLMLTMAISVSLVALLVWRLVARVEHLTRRDAMTDTLNRRAIADAMQALQSLHERGHPFAVVLADIDHFKRVNDDFGHAAGDAALLHFVAIVRGCLREPDLLGRLGGEEFCVLLPHTSVAAAVQVAERVRATLQEHPLAWRGQTLPMTASFGVTAGSGGDPLGERALARADRQVYRAKDQGRNRVCVGEEAFG